MNSVTALKLFLLKLSCCGTVDIKVTCNNITAMARFYINKQRCAFILGLEFCKDFKLVTIAPVCIQQRISMKPNLVEAVHITKESAGDYHKLKKKWKENLPLGRVTGDPLEDLKQIFPETFDGQVGLFEGEVSLKLSPDAKPIQLPPCAVPQSIMPQLKELDKMEQEGIIRACPETAEWVHNLVTVVKKNRTSLPRSEKSEQVPDLQCSLHCILGRCSAQLQEWSVLLHTGCREGVLDQTT